MFRLAIFLIALCPLALGQPEPAKPAPTVQGEPKPRFLGDPYYLPTCATCDKQLGHDGGATIAKIVDGRDLRFCSDRCLAAYEADPPAMSAILDATMTKDQLPYYPPGPSVVTGKPLPEKPVDFVWHNRLFRVADDKEKEEFLRTRRSTSRRSARQLSPPSRRTTPCSSVPSRATS